jgi:hypothetical protein
MSQTQLNIVYVMNRNGNVTAELQHGSMDTDKSVSEILQMLGTMKNLGPGAQLFISVAPGKKLSELGLQPGSTIIIMGK